MEIILLLVTLAATTVGAISGVGGGVIIKPIMDALMDVGASATSFMSSCIMLCMSMVSIYRGRKDEIDINFPISLALAIGAAIGGIFGKALFDFIPDNQALIQSSILFVINIAIYFYIKFKGLIKPLNVESLPLSGVIGCCLGTVSSFLGIGGGPINIAVLYIFYSSTPKVTAKRSIFIILLSQISGITTTLITGIPANVNYVALVLMIGGGCFGAIIGGKISKKLTDAQVDDLFTDVLVAVIILNAYNMGKLL